MRISAVTCVKNEGPFLLEWIAYNRLIGVTDFLIYSNDCSDGTDDLLDALALRGLVRHLPNPASGRNYQMEALRDARKQDIVAASDWIWVADVDEFLDIHTGDGTIPALVEACGDPRAISVTMQHFANCGVEAFEDRPVIGQFHRTHNPDLWCGETAIEVKTLVRKNFPLHYLGAHRPFIRARGNPPEPAWTDGSGRHVPRKFLLAENPRRIRRFPAKGARNFATLNHYPLRSLDSYLVKSDRGDVNRRDRAFDIAYWRAHNDPAWEDRRIQRHLPALDDALAGLRADPELAMLHARCVRLHRERRDALLGQTAFRELRAAILAAPPLPPQEEAMLADLGLQA